MQHQEIITRLYTDFNNRNINGVFKFFTPDVEWPNGWEGGYIHGQDEVRDYWTRQWAEINPIVTPVEIEDLADGHLLVAVKQVVKDLDGNLIADSMVNHTYQFEGGLIKKMIIS